MSKRYTCLTLVAAALAGYAGGALSGQWQAPAQAQNGLLSPSVVGANQFRLLSNDNKVSAVLSIEDGNRPALRLMDKNETVRVFVGLKSENGEDIPVVNLDDKDGTTRVQLSLASNGEPKLVMRDTKEAPLVSAGVINGNPRVSVLGPNGTSEAALGVFVKNDHSPGLVVRGKGTNRLTATVFPDGSAGFNLMNEKGEPAGSLTVKSNGLCSMQQYSKDKKTKTAKE